MTYFMTPYRRRGIGGLVGVGSAAIAAIFDSVFANGGANPNVDLLSTYAASLMIIIIINFE
jgi:hypothetical protein